MKYDPNQPQLFPYLTDPPDDGFVYALRMPSGGVKFGYTGRAPKVRARELGGQLIAYAYGTLDDEAAIHRRLTMFRIGRTEDFWPVPDVLNAVWSLNAEPPVP